MRYPAMLVGTLGIVAACGGATGPQDPGGGAACHGIVADTGLDVTLRYHALIDDLVNSTGVGISVSDSGHFQAHLSQLPGADSQFVRWAGTMAETSMAWVNQLYIVGGSDTTTLTAAGATSEGNPQDSNSAVGLVVDVRQCSYRLVGTATVNADWATGGHSAPQPTQILKIQLVGPVPVSAGGVYTNSSDSVPAHSLTWLDAYADSNAAAPQGIAASLFAGTTDEYPITGISGGFALRKSN